MHSLYTKSIPFYIKVLSIPQILIATGLLGTNLTKTKGLLPMEHVRAMKMQAGIKLSSDDIV